MAGSKRSYTSGWRDVARQAAGSGIFPHNGSEQGCIGSPTPAPSKRRRRASASSLTNSDRVNAAPPPLPQRTGSSRIYDHLEESQRERVDTTIMFRFGEGERVRREQL